MRLGTSIASGALLLGSAALVILAAIRLPAPPDILRAPATPYDRTVVRDAVPAVRLLQRAAAMVPPGASVAFRSEPPDAKKDTSLHRDAIAMLPGRKVWPAALWGTASPELEGKAEYLLVLGPKPAAAPGELLLDAPEGSVWKRRGR